MKDKKGSEKNDKILKSAIASQQMNNAKDIKWLNLIKYDFFLANVNNCRC